MILLIDNYDSFTYNLVQLAGTVNPDIRVVRNDEVSVEDVKEMSPTHIIISPGPGHPKKAGICEELIMEMKGKVPILGICLVTKRFVRLSERQLCMRKSLCTESRAPYI